MFASTVLNYMDRQTITLVESQIRDSFSIPDFAGFGWVLSAFFMTYALFQVPAGFLVDRWDLRWSYAAAVAWWSLAAVATAAAPSLGWLIMCRALLGIGESFNWPCALRVTARVLPPADRSLGNGIFNSGAAVGAVLTPIVVIFLSPRLGWRATFVVIGSLGFIWVAAWLFLMTRGKRSGMLALPATATDDQSAHSKWWPGLLAVLSLSVPPREYLATHPKGWPRLSLPARNAFAWVALASVAVAISARWYGQTAVWLGIALAMLGPLAVAAFFPMQDLEGAGWAKSLHEIVRLRRFWILVVVSISINICWHFLINWVPTYLKRERLLLPSTAGYLTAATFLAADVGNLGGGLLSRWLATSGMNVVRARMTVMCLCICLILAGPALSVSQGDTLVIVLLCLMAAGTAAFMANYFAFTQEVSSRHTGLIAGYLGGLGNLFVAAYLPFAGVLRDRTGSFTPNFLIVGLAPIVGITVLLLGWGQAHGAGAAPSADPDGS
jgi:ACS family hexuronate transporter-like MFS transporter